MFMVSKGLIWPAKINHSYTGFLHLRIRKCVDSLQLEYGLVKMWPIGASSTLSGKPNQQNHPQYVQKCGNFWWALAFTEILIGALPWCKNNGLFSGNWTLCLVGGWPTPPKNMKVSWDDYSQLNGKIKTCSKPPTSCEVENEQPITTLRWFSQKHSCTSWSFCYHLNHRRST